MVVLGRFASDSFLQQYPLEDGWVHCASEKAVQCKL